MPTASQQYTNKRLREERGQIRTKLEAIGDKLRLENRAMSSEEQAQFEALKTSFAAVSEAIRKSEADMAALDSLLAAEHEEAPPTEGGEGEGEVPPAEPAQNSRRIPGRQDRSHRPKGGDGATSERSRIDKALAFQAWCRKQHGRKLTRAHTEACARVGVNPRSRYFDVPLTRTLGTAVTKGGYTIAREFSGMLEQALKDYSNVRGVCGEMSTTTGATLDYPTEDDTANTGELLSEATETGFTDTTFGTVTFNAYKFTSNGILINYELLEDSAFNLEQILATQLGIRLGRAQGSYFTTGTGTSQPHGIVTASTLGVTSASATAIAPKELTRLEHSIDPAYRNAPGFGFMMHDTTLAYLMTLTVNGTTDIRRLITESWQDPSSGPSLRLNGRPVYANQFMDQSSGSGGVPVTAKKHVICGDFSKFLIRDVGPVRIRRLDERYAEKDQVGFIGFMRSDSRCINTGAIKHLLQA